MMNGIRPAVAAAVLLVAACGTTDATSAVSSTPTTPVASQAARQLLLSSVSRAASESVRIDASLSGTLSGTGTVAVLGNMPVGVKMHLDVASPSDLSGKITMSLASWTLDVPIVVINGTEFVSSGNGATWKAVPGGAAPASANVPIQYLQSIDGVADVGASRINSRPVEEYHATLDPQKMSALLKGIAATVAVSSPSFAPVLEQISFDNGQVNAYVDRGGNLIAASGYADASVDASAIEPGLTGRATIHGLIVCSFSDYGAAITVTPPPSGANS
jgi:hypothetical protein